MQGAGEESPFQLFLVDMAINIALCLGVISFSSFPSVSNLTVTLRNMDFDGLSK